MSGRQAKNGRFALSDHYDGRRFHNGDGLGGKSLADVLRWLRQRPKGLWQWRAAAPGPRPPLRIGDGALRATYVNQATVLLQFDGLNLLTDPVWSERVSPFSFAGPQRYRPPGLRFEDLPRIDVVVISHNHYDHMDARCLRALQRVHQPQVIAPLGNAERLRRWGLREVVELDWGQQCELPNGRRFHAEPAQHWSGRGLRDRNRSLWMSGVIETAGGPVYFAGDSGYGPHFRKIHARHGDMRLALLPIGAYLPRWFMAYQHMDPAEAVQAHLDLRARMSLGIHYGTFNLADDGPEQPVRELETARQAHGVSAAAFPAAAFGEGYDVPPIPAAMPQPEMGVSGA